MVAAVTEWMKSVDPSRSWPLSTSQAGEVGEAADHERLKVRDLATTTSLLGKLRKATRRTA
jgi:hypothetical protein